jgi:transcriptional regulator with XRE-family HTH domain
MPQPRKVQQNNHIHQTRIIARQLKILRKKRGLTQSELAEKVGLTLNAISAYEVGRVHMVDVTLVDLAKALNVSADVLLGIKSIKPDIPVSRRLMKRIVIVDTFSEYVKKNIIKFLDDTIRINQPTSP